MRFEFFLCGMGSRVTITVLNIHGNVEIVYEIWNHQSSIDSNR